MKRGVAMQAWASGAGDALATIEYGGRWMTWTTTLSGSLAARPATTTHSISAAVHWENLRSGDDSRIPPYLSCLQLSCRHTSWRLRDCWKCKLYRSFSGTESASFGERRAFLRNRSPIIAGCIGPIWAVSSGANTTSPSRRRSRSPEVLASPSPSYSPGSNGMLRVPEPPQRTEAVPCQYGSTRHNIPWPGVLKQRRQFTMVPTTGSFGRAPVADIDCIIPTLKGECVFGKARRGSQWCRIRSGRLRCACPLSRAGRNGYGSHECDDSGTAGS
jgi:hypothetical protein